jgi:cysteine desulfurase/selenocysteine lyase
VNSLVPKDDFIGISHVAHLAAGGETPSLRSHLDTVGRFLCNKGEGMPGRERNLRAAQAARHALARLVGGRPEDVALLASASEGLCVAAAGIDWRPGDNVVLERVEYPSVRYAWERLPHRVSLRGVGAIPMASLAEIREAVDARTRAIAVSHVSYLTGARHDLGVLREIADRVGARLVVDASHALGVVPVDGRACDAVVSCAYKFLLGTHGVGVFYVNPDRWPDLAPPWAGWHSTVSMEWEERSRRGHALKPDAERFEIGNLAWLNVGVLANALAYLERLGTPAIEDHVLALGDELWDGLHALDLPVTTPRDRGARAGNICFAADAPDRIERQLRRAGVLVWGSEGRVRLSLHVYNDSGDVARALRALKDR